MSCKTAQEAARALKDVGLVADYMEGEAQSKVISQVPFAQDAAVTGSGVLLYTGDTAEDADATFAEDTVEVPDLTGKTRLEAYDALAAIGLKLRMEPEDQSGVAIRQKPEAHEKIAFGQSVTVEFSQVQP